jgi:hypothetical protein
VWTVALKPKGAGSGSQGLGSYQPAINAAHRAVSTADHASAAAGGSAAPAVTTPVAKTAAAVAHPAAKPATAAVAPAATKPAPVVTVTHSVPASASQLTVSGALAAKRVIAILFYNPAAADDLAVKRELAQIPTHGGGVVKLAVPLSQLSRYGAIVNAVPVDQSPTLVLIDPTHEATTIVGFADGFEIAQRIDAALAH